MLSHRVISNLNMVDYSKLKYHLTIDSVFELVERQRLGARQASHIAPVKGKWASACGPGLVSHYEMS